jgi:hypothetical protein
MFATLPRALALVALCCLACAVAKSDVEKTNAAFEEWFAGAGATADGVAVADFPLMGRGVQATKTIHDKHQLFSVPLSAVMCRETIVSKAGSPALGKVYAGIKSEMDIVAVYLMHQRALGAASEWAPYINVLPEQVDVIWLFSKTERALLQDKTEQRKAIDARKGYEKSFKALESQIGEIFKDVPEAGQKFASKAYYMWACSLVGSRALTMSGDRYLVPFADMFNYEPNQQTRAANNGASFLDYHKITKTHFNVFTDRTTETGKQVFEDYGDNDNYLYIM